MFVFIVLAVQIISSLKEIIISMNEILNIMSDKSTWHANCRIFILVNKYKTHLYACMSLNIRVYQNYTGCNT